MFPGAVPHTTARIFREKTGRLRHPPIFGSSPTPLSSKFYPSVCAISAFFD